MSDDQRHDRQAEQLAHQFLDACKRIEQALKRRHPDRRFYGLREAVDASSGDALVAHNRKALDAFIPLRNALSHQPFQNGRPIATPLQATVDEALRIAGEIESPRRVGDVVQGGPIHVAGIGDPLLEHLRAMLKHDYSQMPVREDGRTTRVLTTNAVARWVADHMDENGEALLESATVRSVLEYAEPDETIKTVKRATPVHLVVADLVRATPPRMILITENGKTSEAPIGVIVAADLPRLFHVMEGRSTSGYGRVG